MDCSPLFILPVSARGHSVSACGTLPPRRCGNPPPGSGNTPQPLDACDYVSRSAVERRHASSVTLLPMALPTRNARFPLAQFNALRGEALTHAAMLPRLGWVAQYTQRGKELARKSFRPAAGAMGAVPPPRAPLGESGLPFPIGEFSSGQERKIPGRSSGFSAIYETWFASPR